MTDPRAPFDVPDLGGLPTDRRRHDAERRPSIGCALLALSALIVVGGLAFLLGGLMQ